jgi:hypothetical protein
MKRTRLRLCGCRLYTRTGFAAALASDSTIEGACGCQITWADALPSRSFLLARAIIIIHGNMPGVDFVGQLWPANSCSVQLFGRCWLKPPHGLSEN